MSHYRAKRHLAIREAMRGKTERDPRRERARARDQADRSDNAASRACRFEVSAEHHQRTDCFWPNPTTLCYLTKYIRSAETGEIFGLKPSHLRCAPQLRAQHSAGQTRCARSHPASVSFNCIFSGGEGGIDSAAAATSGLKPSHLQCAPQLRAQRSAGQTRCTRSHPARISFDYILFGGEGGIRTREARSKGLLP